MRRLFLIAIAAALFASQHCGAQGTCPWINAATAEGVLESKVDAIVQEMPGKDMNCLFTSVGASGTRSLVVEVRDVGGRVKEYAEAESKCTSAPASVNGLGTEAFQCEVTHTSSHGMMILGRVREKLFVVSVTMSGHHIPTAASLREKVNIAAGQVVGNLF